MQDHSNKILTNNDFSTVIENTKSLKGLIVHNVGYNIFDKFNVNYNIIIILQKIGRKLG